MWSDNCLSRVWLLPLPLLLLRCNAPIDAEQAPIRSQVRCQAVELRTLADEVELRGTVTAAPDRSATLSAEVPGRIVRLLVREGDEVAAGNLIAEIEAQPQDDLLREARAMLAEATANRDAALMEVSHEESLVKSGIAAKRSLEALRGALSHAEAAVAGATAQVHVAKKRLSRSVIRAPMGGVIVNLRQRAGEVVDGTPATPICDVVDMSSLELLAPARPADLIHLQRGQAARVGFSALEGATMAATVRSVGRSVGHGGMGQVWLALQPGTLLPPLGVVGTAAIAVSEPRQIVTVPSNAVRSAGGQDLEVVVCEGGFARAQKVETGRRLDGFVEIRKGLAGGQQIVTDKVMAVADGMAIERTEAAP